MLEKTLETLDVTPARIEVIHNLMNLKKIRDQASQQPQTVITEPYLVHVARLVPVKQQELLLSAYHYSGLQMPLVIIGDGPVRNRLENLATELDLMDRVYFLGQLENPYPWIRQATALVLSSRKEGLGLVLIEALALGTQCVSTDAEGGIKDVLIDEQQRLIADMDIKSLAAKLCEAVNDPVIVKMAWAEHFDSRNIVHKFIGLIPTGRTVHVKQRQYPSTTY